MIDLHIHILPGIDDGSSSLDESLIMAKQAYDSGVTDMIVTPHSHQKGRFENYYGEELQQRFDVFKQALQDQHIPLNVYLGMEIYADDDIGHYIKTNKLIGLNFSDYYLIEFAFKDHPQYINMILKKVLSIGKIPVIAHPERYVCVQNDPQLVEQWLELGCYTQVNKGSLLGRFGKRIQQTAFYLMDHDNVTMLASDAHKCDYRTPDMEKLRDMVELYYGIDKAEELLYINPQRILKGEKHEKRSC